MAARTRAAICHIEIPAPDLAKAKTFYSKVFGWQVSLPRQMPGYGFWAAEGNRGGFDADMKPIRSGFNLYLKVADIPRTLKRIEAAGGKVLKGKTQIGGGYGFFATFLDPNGNKLHVWSLT